MKDFLLKIKLVSPLANSITGDQLTGGFLYYLSITEKSSFGRLLESFKENKPPFLFSSMFPADMLPINSNFLVKEFFLKDGQDFDKDRLKKIKKLRFLPKDYLTNLLAKQKAIEDLDLESVVGFRLTKVSVKNSTVYTQRLVSFKNQLADVYLRVFEENLERLFSEEKIKEFFGYFVGKKLSSGLSHLDFLKKEETDLSHKGEFFIALSPFVPDSAEQNLYQPLYFDFFIKYPKLGSSIGGANPFKKKIITIAEGSVFRSNQRSRHIDFLGRVIENVSFSKPETIQITQTFGFFFDL